jgi:hypothetical protein
MKKLLSILILLFIIKSGHSQWIEKLYWDGGSCSMSMDGYTYWAPYFTMLNDSTGYRLYSNSIPASTGQAGVAKINNYGQLLGANINSWVNGSYESSYFPSQYVSKSKFQLLNHDSLFYLESVNVSDNYTIIRSGDHLTTDTSIFNTSSSFISDFFFLDFDNGYINLYNSNNNYLLRYSSGIIDTILYTPNSASSKIQFIKDSLGFMQMKNLGTNKIELLKSSDIGQNWTTVFDSIPASIKEFDFVSDSVGFLVLYNNHIYKTIDKGNSWSFISIDYNRFQGIYDFVDETLWYAVQDPDSLYKTYDEGQNWIYDSLTINPIIDIDIRKDTLGYAISNNCYLYTKGGKLISVGINETKHENTIEFYPNPVDDILYLKNVKTNTKINVLDINGKTLLSKLNTSFINTSDLPTGIYVVQFINNGDISHHKLIKK